MRKSKKELSKAVKKVSRGVLSKAVDLSLVTLFYGIEVSSGGYSKVGLAGDRAVDDLEFINYDTIKNSLGYLKRKGFIQAAKEGVYLPKITKEGRKRLKAVLPSYDSKRVWDGRVYLVNYDLPRQNNIQRNLLREYLKKIGCGSLQYSLWITPYNPKKLIVEFVEKHNLEGNLILVSSLGRDGTVGDTDLKELMDNVYNLSDLNSRYLDFTESVKEKKIKSKDQLIFAFISILKDDPQIPFELLPVDWEGEMAYELFKKYYLVM